MALVDQSTRTRLEFRSSSQPRPSCVHRGRRSRMRASAAAAALHGPGAPRRERARQQQNRAQLWVGGGCGREGRRWSDGYARQQRHCVSAGECTVPLCPCLLAANRVPCLCCEYHVKPPCGCSAACCPPPVLEHSCVHSGRRGAYVSKEESCGEALAPHEENRLLRRCREGVVHCPTAKG